MALLFPLINSFEAKSRDLIVKGILLNNSKFSIVQVKQFGIGSYLVQTLPVNKETGEFEIVFPSNALVGIYRFQYSQTIWNGYVDVIINNKDSIIELCIDVGSDKLDVKFSGSYENEIWHQYQEKINCLLDEIETINHFVSQYSVNNNLKEKAWKQRQKAIQRCYKMRSDFIAKNESPWLQALVNYHFPVFVDPTMHERLQLAEKHDRFWEMKPTWDTLIINTPIYTTAILNYLNYYLDPTMEFLQQEQDMGINRCIDTIISRFSFNSVLKNFAIKYLQLGFREIGKEEVLQFIDESYAMPFNRCEMIKDSAFEQRISFYNTFKRGMPAPGKDLFEKYKLEKGIKDDSDFLLFFWASWCPHCVSELPIVQEWARSNTGVKVIAISLDEFEGDYLKLISTLPEFYHYCDFLKWNSPWVKDFQVNATPSFFWVDKDWRIIKKASGIKSLQEN